MTLNFEDEESNFNYSRLAEGNYDFAITGGALKEIHDENIISEVVKSAKVFARMKPNQKT